MGEKINWDGFSYPEGCTLEDHQKAAVIRGANSGLYHPFRICRTGKLHQCPPEIEQECFDEGVRIILAAKRK